MAFGHGKNEVVIANGYNVSSYLHSAKMPQKKDTADVTTFGAVAKSKLSGIADGMISLDGFFDGAAGAADAILNTIFGHSIDDLLLVWPQGDAVSALGKALKAIEVSYEVTGSLGAAVGIAVGAEADGGLEQVTSLLSLASALVAGNGTTVNNGAPTTSGGSAYLSVVGKSGGTTLDVVLHHSTDNFGADDSVLGTFTQVNAANANERITFAGTVKRYVRAVSTLGAGGTWNVNVALHRA